MQNLNNVFSTQKHTFLLLLRVCNEIERMQKHLMIQRLIILLLRLLTAVQWSDYTVHVSSEWPAKMKESYVWLIVKNIRPHRGSDDHANNDRHEDNSKQEVVYDAPELWGTLWPTRYMQTNVPPSDFFLIWNSPFRKRYHYLNITSL